MSHVIGVKLGFSLPGLIVFFKLQSRTLPFQRPLPFPSMIPRRFFLLSYERVYSFQLPFLFRKQNSRTVGNARTAWWAFSPM